MGAELPLSRDRLCASPGSRQCHIPVRARLGSSCCPGCSRVFELFFQEPNTKGYKRQLLPLKQFLQSTMCGNQGSARATLYPLEKIFLEMMVHRNFNIS